MDSIRTNQKFFVEDEEGYCIAGITAVAEEGGLRLYVAWEWKPMAEKKIFGFFKSRKLYTAIDSEAIEETRDYGIDISSDSDVKKIFSYWF